MAAVVSAKVTKPVFDFVHKSQLSDEFGDAVARLLAPHVLPGGKEPLIRNLVLAHNARIEPSGNLSGYVAVVDGAARASAILTHDLGCGVTWFPITSAFAIDGTGNELELPFSEPQLEAAFNDPIRREKIKVQDLAPGSRTSVVRDSDYESTKYYLVVQGNDARAATDFLAAIDTAANLDQIMKTNAHFHDLYTSLMERSRQTRMAVADAFANVYGLKLDASKHNHHDTHFVQLAQVHSAPLKKAASGSPFDVYLVYNNVVDPSDAHSGVMVYRGPMAGFALLTAQPHTVLNQASTAWENSTPERPFSMFHADTGLHSGEASRVPDRHAHTNAAIANMATRRLRWTGPVNSYNPLSLEIYNAYCDETVLKVQTALKAPPGGTIKTTLLDTLVTELPGLTVHSMSAPELLDVFTRCSETEFAITSSSPILKDVVKYWPQVRAALPNKKTSLAEVFGREDTEKNTVVVSADVVRAVAQVTTANAVAAIAAK